MQVHPYLNFDGQCEEAFTFYAECLGGTIEAMLNHGDSPMAEHVPPEHHAKILHARLAVGNTVLLGSDSPADNHTTPQGIYVSLNVDTAADAERIFAALAENGQVQMPLAKTFWAERFGLVVDRFGIPWMLNCAPES